MKRLLILLTLFSMAVPSLAYQKEHRGLFFQTALGFSYLNTQYDDTYKSDYQRNCNYSSNSEENPDQCRSVEIYSHSFSGFSFPEVNVKLGASIGNMVVLFSTLDVGNVFGHAKAQNTEYDENVTKGTVHSVDFDDKLSDKDAPGFEFAAGLGFYVYPFRNPQSPLNGLFIGTSSGLGGYIVTPRGDYSTDLEFLNIYTRYEIGKDWWITDTWSLGFGIAYQSMFSNEPIDGDGIDSDHKFSIAIRLTRG
ncbi:MAG: hypothetical protein HUK21_00135 [Fibrobacteraceae bacterium]|nr:hypothetical protein [Fibrobacteraceae bacterium]